MLSSDQKARLRALSLIVAVIWVVLGVVFSWPLWLWIGLGVVSLLAPSLIAWGLVEWNLRERSGKAHELAEEEVVEEQPPTPEPPRPQQYSVQGVPLRSAREDYQFIFSCNVFWRLLPNAPGLPHANPGGLAADMILMEVASLAASTPPAEESRARYRMTSMLGAVRTDPTGRVEVWADGIALSLSEDDAERLRRLAEVRKNEEVWENERSYERNVRAYLGDDVLTSPGSAVIWWLAGPRTGEKQRVDEVVEKISNLQKLTSAATMTELPGSAVAGIDFGVPSLSSSSYAFDDQAASHTGLPKLPFVVAPQPDENGFGSADTSEGTFDDHAMGLVERLPENPERAMFARRLADLLEAQGHQDTAELVRERFDAPLNGSSNNEQGVDQHDSENRASEPLEMPGSSGDGFIEQPSDERFQEPVEWQSDGVPTSGNADESAHRAGEDPQIPPADGETSQQRASAVDRWNGERPI
ncbi:hypothetical protein [Saccharopolyspora pogona]|uniref:hypothetical protein n=1 Tax=Saccharopolyspora pogona TaxID=333966 RepID=UPI00168923DD|nr:hypothetical protein [Saccharopolyspora pogona]